MSGISRRRFQRNYSPEEILALVENYDELIAKRDKLWILVRLNDLEQAIRKLPPAERNAVVLCGLTGMSVRQACKAQGLPETRVSQVWRHYNRGLSKLEGLINGTA